MANNTYTNISDLPTLDNIGENTWVPVEITGKEGKKVDLNSVTPGTLNTDNSTAQAVNANESLAGTVNLHKVAKTGSYNDLLNKPTIPTVGTLNTDNSSTQTVNANESLSGTIKLHKVAKTGRAKDLYWGYGNEDLDNCTYLLGTKSTGSGTGTNYSISWFGYERQLSKNKIKPYRNTLYTFNQQFDNTSTEASNYQKIFQPDDSTNVIYKFIDDKTIGNILNFKTAVGSGEMIDWADKEHYFVDINRLTLLMPGTSYDIQDDSAGITYALIKIIPSESYSNILPITIAYDDYRNFSHSTERYNSNWDSGLINLECINMATPQIDVSKPGIIRIIEGFYEIIQYQNQV